MPAAANTASSPGGLHGHHLHAGIGQPLPHEDYDDARWPDSLLAMRMATRLPAKVSFGVSSVKPLTRNRYACPRATSRLPNPFSMLSVPVYWRAGAPLTHCLAICRLARSGSHHGAQSSNSAAKDTPVAIAATSQGRQVRSERPCDSARTASAYVTPYTTHRMADIATGCTRWPMRHLPDVGSRCHSRSARVHRPQRTSETIRSSVSPLRAGHGHTSDRSPTSHPTIRDSQPSTVGGNATASAIAGTTTTGTHHRRRSAVHGPATGEGRLARIASPATTTDITTSTEAP